jgi:hypothetical protein
MLNDIAGLKSDVEDLFEKASKADSQLQLNIVELSDKTFKEFGRIKDLISELNKLIAIAQKTSELNKILIDEIKAEASNPLGG